MTTPDQIHIDGVPVASLTRLDSPHGSHATDTLWLVRSTGGWSLLTLTCNDAHDETHHGAETTVRVRHFETLAHVAASIEREYWHATWVELLDQCHDRDPQLHEIWVRERVEQDFQAATIFNKDLARYNALIGGEPMPAPGRQLPGWADAAVNAMAVRLTKMGYRILGTADIQERDPPGLDDRQLGALRLGRYGYETTGIVRVDDVGEIFVRLPDPEHAAGPLFRPQPARPESSHPPPEPPQAGLDPAP